MNEAPPIIDSTPPPLPDFKDRRTGLLVFGIIEILLGVFCLLLIGFMLLGQAMLSRNAGAAMSLQLLAPALFIYLGLAVMFIWVGIGSIQRRRWARAIMLIFAWFWLGIGLVTVPLMAFILPRSLEAATKQGASLPPGILIGIVIFQIAVMSLILIVLPAAFVVFYRNPNVKATCEARHPTPAWTDACPLPLLGVSLMLWLGALMLLGMPLAYRGVMPFFGTLLEGWTGTLFAIGFAALWIWLGRLWFRARPIGWWMLLAAVLLLSVSSYLTFQRVDLMAMYQKMGYPPQQIEQIHQQGFLTNDTMAWFSVVWLLPMLGYLLWVKRFFKSQR